jgi:hypothetical protein
MKITKSSHPKIVALMQQTYPDYKGRRFFLVPKSSIDANVEANWNGGTKYYYKFLVYKDEKFSTFVPPDFAPWKRPDTMQVRLTDSLVCITHTFFCGQDRGLTFYYNENCAIWQKDKLFLYYSTGSKNV